jgi:CDP-paratose 2-epimerase
MTGAFVRLAASASLRLDDEPRVIALARLASGYDVASLRLRVDDEGEIDEVRAREALSAFSRKDIALVLDAADAHAGARAIAFAQAAGASAVELRLIDMSCGDLSILAQTIESAAIGVRISGAAVSLASLETLAGAGLLACAAAIVIDDATKAQAYEAQSSRLGVACEIHARLAHGSGPKELSDAMHGPARVLYVDMDEQPALLRIGSARAADDPDLGAFAAALAARPRITDNVIVIVGGAGFVGCNLADDFARSGKRVRIVDNLSRPGSERNALWLRRRHGDLVEAVFADAADPHALHGALAGAAAIFNLAAQVAVTRSMETPLADFDANARACLNILEWARRNAPRAPVIFASTNKVYGCLEAVRMQTRNGRHEPAEACLRERGLSEAQPLDLRTPYGCSKGAADQYVLDYAKSFGLRTAVLRMSCVYGPRQFGNEDQGWVAHFLIRALSGEPITIYGDGRQVRDVLHVSDAVSAYRSVLDSIDEVRGEAFNLGGGPANAISLLQLIEHASTLCRRAPSIRHEEWRTGDQPWFVADTTKLSQRLGWRPRTGWRAGVAELASWIGSNLIAAQKPSRGEKASVNARRPASPKIALEATNR